MFIFGSGTPDLLKDTASTFIMGSGSTFENLIISAAKAQKTKKATVVVIDVPAATQIFEDADAVQEGRPRLLDGAGRARHGRHDARRCRRSSATTPRAWCTCVGNDSFCIAAFNGLRTAGFEGQVTAIPQCFSDATRTAVPADFLEGIKITASSPVDNPKDPSIKQYYAVLDKFGASRRRQVAPDRSVDVPGHHRVERRHAEPEG